MTMTAGTAARRSAWMLLSSPIKYVFYVIRENRTYDQVFGDDDADRAEPVRSGTDPQHESKTGTRFKE